MNLLHPQARVIDAATGRVLDPDQVLAAAARFAGLPPGVVFALTPTDIDSVALYLGALAAHRPISVLDPDLDGDVLRALVERFAPALVTGAPGAPPDGYAVRDGWWVRGSAAVEPHPDLGLLLATSGSTGNPKLVRLSRAAVLANAEAIGESLGITPADVAPTTLPLFYTYGLSVLNSHLLRGATVVLERGGIMQREFWAAAGTYGITTLAAVPYQYEMLRRLRFDPAKYPALRTLTQAGGRLRVELVEDFAARMAAVGGRLFVMYGQTEATARMAVLPPDRLAGKLGSAGRAIPGGSFSIADGEVVYTGPNVMMGYAERAADLARGDDLRGVLRTGDLGRLDDEGFLYLTGRLKRIGKVFGVRVNLDDIERTLAGHGAVAAVAGDDRLHVFIEGADAEATRSVRGELAKFLDTHFSGLDVRGIPSLPLLPTGKIDYRSLEALV
ncbi:AMP-binding protein [Amorphoplanes digitatis]|uniref:Acyl-CoA synthetase (AMP-forming)/AMP-acid ligase II n=1 Tax=Actinoplanes digitatis TaxID=1868 RepID=A0A7W7I5T3_9ACTN|nr:AMP-binding protein [Actinoplanes digitatis]MBB4766816.1 acyl-CoA synthetase (AMP-forming)/AMP-acid ligase II [Actinoplanes digitatis]GID96416.1 AMP-dependent acyl-CoA synthetase [Actinoplanes digitatis]